MRSHLGRYVEGNPGQLLNRARYAELLLKLHRLPEARTQFEQLVCDGQGQSGSEHLDLIHCHGRLMEIAEESDDRYNEHLHRGIGLFLLARRGALEEDFPAEGLLCKAAAELTWPISSGPRKPALVGTCTRSGSPGTTPAALRRLREAEAAAPFSCLSPSEHCALLLAYERYQTERQRK